MLVQAETYLYFDLEKEMFPFVLHYEKHVKKKKKVIAAAPPFKEAITYHFPQRLVLQQNFTHDWWH